MIKVDSIHKSFADNHVLKGISAEFEQGKTNLIIGQSGSGKTVFLKCMLGLHELDAGSIFFDGRDFNRMDFKERKEVRKELGMVFQGGALFDSMTVEENVMFPLNMFTNQTRGEKLMRVNEVLDRVNLNGKNHLFPSETSGGMQKRIAIARAISMNPKYLFCDEPNSGLDPRTAIVIDTLIAEITHEYQMTTVINTHDMNSVMEIGEKIVFLKDGHKAWEGTSDSILKTDHEAVVDFVYTSKILRSIREKN